MKRMALLLLLLFAPIAEAQIKQITGGGYQNTAGQPCAGCVLYLKLTHDATVTGTNQIVPSTNSYILDANGNVPANSNLWANDQLTPSGLTYIATLTNAGGGRIWGPEYLFLSGASPISLSQIVPVASSSVFFANPAFLTAVQTWTALQTFNGGVTVNGTFTVNNSLFVPIVVASVDQTLQSADINNTLLYSVPSSSSGIYRISCYVVETRAATTSSTLPSCVIQATDNETSIASFFTQTSTNTNNVIGAVGLLFNPAAPVVRAKASTNINYSTSGYASVGGTSMQFSIHVKLEYLGL